MFTCKHATINKNILINQFCFLYWILANNFNSYLFSFVHVNIRHRNLLAVRSCVHHKSEVTPWTFKPLRNCFCEIHCHPVAPVRLRIDLFGYYPLKGGVFCMICYYHFKNFNEYWRPSVDTSYINEKRGVADVISGHSVTECEVKDVADSVPQSWIWNQYVNDYMLFTSRSR